MSNDYELPLEVVKRCSKCATVKPVSEFHRSAGKRDGLKAHCKQCRSRHAAESRKENPDIYRQRAAQYYLNNRDHVLARTNARHRANAAGLSEWGARYYAENRERVKQKNLRWMRNNPERMSFLRARRRALESNAPTVEFSAEQLAAKWAYWGSRCWVCGGEATATDHVKPLAKGGAHMLCNLRPICRPCNSSKRDKWPYAR